MSDELERMIRRGQEAKAILENPLFIEAHDTMRANLFKGWCATPADSAELRERLYRMYVLLDTFRQTFERTMVEGDDAATMLEQLKRERLSEADRRKRAEQMGPIPGAPL